MKRLLLLILIAFFGVMQVKAQPTLTATNTNPQIGEQFISNMVSFNASLFNANLASGPNHTWNFSSLTPYQSQTIQVLYRPSAGVAWNVIQNSDAAVGVVFEEFDFLKLYSDSLTLIGFDDFHDFTQGYSNPVKKLQYPFTYNSAFTDHFAGQTQSMANHWSMSGHIVVKADGYGTLILPFGVVPNVLRVKSIKVSNDMYGIDSTTTLAWYSPGIHVPILTFNKVKIISPNYTGISYPAGYYINPFALSVKEEAASVNLQTFPNPATSQVNIQYTLKSSSKVSLIISDALGREVIRNEKDKQPAGNNSEKLDTSKLLKGVYLVRLETQEGVSIKQLLIQ